jgi:hypothetical protein
VWLELTVVPRQTRRAHAVEDKIEGKGKYQRVFSNDILSDEDGEAFVTTQALMVRYPTHQS